MRLLAAHPQVVTRQIKGFGQKEEEEEEEEEREEEGEEEDEEGKERPKGKGKEGGKSRGRVASVRERKQVGSGSE